MDIKKLLSAFRKLSDKLDSKDFDLEAWKTSAISLFSRSFGTSDPKTKSLEELKIDYGSWALRDAPSTYDPRESCKRKGREIVHAAMEEIELFGLPNQFNPVDHLEGIYSEDEIKQITSLIGDESKSADLKKLLDKAGKEKNVQLLVKLLTSAK